MNGKLFLIAFGLLAYLIFQLGIGLEPALTPVPADADGQAIFYGKGRCGLCHTIGVQRGGKCPNLDGVGSRLTRAFIYEAMTDPSAYVKLDFGGPEPVRYPARMPVINQSPIGLTEIEMEKVILFLQR